MNSTVMQTYRGGPFDLLDPRPEDVRLLDIAEALSKINRFCGNTIFPYSVAQHSVCVSGMLDGTGLELEGLLHDAVEAYTGDLTSPCKAALRAIAVTNGASHDVIKDLEEPIQEVIAQVFGLRHPIPLEVQRADHELLALERRWVLHPSTGVDWSSHMVPPKKLDAYGLPPLEPTQARDAFLARFNALSLRRAVWLRDVKAEHAS